jgi:hypothetical protein
VSAYKNGKAPGCQCTNPTGPCYKKAVCPGIAALVAGLTAGSVAAVVVCAAFAGGLTVAGGTYAIAQQVAPDEETGMSQNPLFEPSQNAGVNPTFVG